VLVPRTSSRQAIAVVDHAFKPRPSEGLLEPVDFMKALGFGQELEQVGEAKSVSISGSWGHGAKAGWQNA
jgi:hypothetical protein